MLRVYDGQTLLWSQLKHPPEGDPREWRPEALHNLDLVHKIFGFRKMFAYRRINLIQLSYEDQTRSAIWKYSTQIQRTLGIIIVGIEKSVLAPRPTPLWASIPIVYPIPMNIDVVELPGSILPQ